MISLKLARKLKDAGLKPECADFELFWLSEVEEIMHVGPGYEPEPEDVWLPGLGRLLAEIERRGYGYDLHTLTTNHEHKYYCAIKLLECACGYRIDNISWGPFKGDTPEAAVGTALLWILERKKEARQNG